MHCDVSVVFSLFLPSSVLVIVPPAVFLAQGLWASVLMAEAQVPENLLGYDQQLVLQNSPLLCLL